ncbi:4'-phosphopantetheinyl transferase superfamily protein [Winogradskya consettensis]|uniref:4'-phosphopantetheinyl transferase n=1 Tax=Winogradskya consettensis TaxID=113560 RepID=A0A919W663_9ACTN|nr:4'-phosphopantetheinyl transferase superfamily protein [Actinoplanes consettensis]GIM82384.1 4'-phosphopantetheinyl transferase [Actinoplanes consettensis]
MTGLQALLPSSVVCVETTTDRDIELYPQERAAIERAVPKRQAEFTTARWCVRQALSRLGLPAAAVVPQERGAPGWPPPVVGSITHCPGFRAAALALRADVLSVGIDAEPNEPLPVGVYEAVSCARERADRVRLGHLGVAWDRLLFSAKESVYKAWYPITHRSLDFTDVVVRIEPDGTFEARQLVAPARVNGTTLSGFSGRWAARGGLIVTAVVV